MEIIQKNTYSKKFEEVFSNLLKLIENDSHIFFIPATFSFIHSKVELKTSCWFLENNTDVIKEVVQSFSIYYYMLSYIKDTTYNMSNYILEKQIEGTSAVEFYYEEKEKILKSSNLSIEIRHSITNPILKEKWKDINNNYCTNINLNYRVNDHNQLIWSSDEKKNNLIDFNEIIQKINTPVHNLIEGTEESLLLDNLLLFCEYSKFKHIYYIPTILTKDVNNYAKRVNGNSVFVVCSFEQLSSEKIITIRNIINSSIAFSAFNDINTLQKNAKDAATKSTKAAIMSRNMSHNLGSHVMAYLKQHLNSVQDVVSNNVLSQLFLNNESIESIIQDPTVWVNRLKEVLGIYEQSNNTNQLKEIALPFLVGLGRFISYLQERQDFIATIATDYVPYYSGVNFKDFIYDELNPDLRFERHQDRAGMKPDNILLGNIARSEGLGRTTSPTHDKSGTLHDIILYFRDFDGHLINSNDPDAKIKHEALEAMRKFFFSLPGGIVGRQALFSIMENVIRNAAKHGDWRSTHQKCLEIKFDIFCKAEFDMLTENSETIDETNRKRLNSFKPIYETYYKHAQGINDLYIITLTDNLLISDKALKKLRQAIIEPYVQDTGEMINANKGIKEMRISASWLRSMDDDIENHPYANISKEEFPWNPQNPWKGNVPILLANIVNRDETEKQGTLQYTFCVVRQKKIAIVTDRKPDIVNKYEQQLLTNSWDIYTFKEFKRPKTNKSYEFILMDTYVPSTIKSEEVETYIKTKFNELYCISPNRLYRADILGQGNIVDRLVDNNYDFKDFDHIVKLLYRTLANAGKEDIISISDDKTKEKYITKQTPFNQEYVEIGDGDCKVNKYIYKKHFEAKTEFNGFMNNKPLNCLYVEGITGNNSTDRLIRNENIDELWVYRHLHAIKSKVAIFDERLFSKIFKIDESDIRAFKTTTINLPLIEDCPPGADIEDYTCNCIQQIKEKIFKFLKNSPNENDIFSRITDLQELRNYINNHQEWFSQKQIKKEPLKADYMSIAYNMKGIDVFNIIKTGNKEFDIYGYCGYSNKSDLAGICDKIGSIKMENNNFLIENKMENFMSKKETNNPTNKDNTGSIYDYFTIHQGLLDKIYEAFEIKDNAQRKHDFTKAFYEKFSNTPKQEIIPYTDQLQIGGKNESIDGFFLPRMYIHSGRSKPALSDMPQKQPFIQYAAIEHAVLDCKYSLIELLDFARYE